MLRGTVMHAVIVVVALVLAAIATLFGGPKRKAAGVFDKRFPPSTEDRERALRALAEMGGYSSAARALMKTTAKA